MTEYAEILHALADGRAVQWQTSNGTWEDQDPRATLAEIAVKDYRPERYRVKPRTIIIGDYEVPEPMRAAPAVGAEYWLVHLGAADSAPRTRWACTDTDRAWLARGLCHAAKEAAELHARALLSFTTREVGK